MNIADHLVFLKKWFKDYVATFQHETYIHARNYAIKLEHTYRVCEEMRMISHFLGLNEEEAVVAEMAALLHDVGRFEQFQRYQTFMDTISIDHGDLGVAIIERYGLVDNLSQEHRELVIEAVRHHNKKTISDKLSEKEHFLTRMLRDADKLDIWNVVIEYYYSNEENESISLNLSEENLFSDKVFSDLCEYKMADKRDFCYLNDFKLNQMAWVFDLNFKCSVKRVKELKFLERIAKVMDNAPQVRTVYSRAQAYVYGNS